MDTEWDRPVTPPTLETDAPILSAEGFEGPLDWLVEQARARRIDLRHLSVLALVETFEAALLQALDGQASATTIVRWGDWLVLAAELTLLRSRLLLPAGADGVNARNEAEALRRRLIDRSEMAAAAIWLSGRSQIGMEVFERGAPETPTGHGRGRTGDVTALLRACLVALTVPLDAAAAFRVRMPFWSVADALARIRHLLDAGGEGEVGLETFLPAVPPDAPERDRRCRAAVASTFVGGLELARAEVVTLDQGISFGPIRAGRATRQGASATVG